MKLQDKVALVTGGASGLGRAACSALLDRGARVVVLDRDAAATAAAVEELGPSSTAGVVGSVTDDGNVRKAAATALDRFGGLHVVVNCAGIGPPGKLLDREGKARPLDNARKIIDVNLNGTLTVAAHCAEAMAAGEHYDEDGSRGVIINVASVAAFDGQVGQSAYSASKAGVAGVTLQLARELAEHGIRVNTIAPGLFLTPLALGELSEKVLDGLKASIAFPRRTGKFDEFAQLVCHLAENDYLNAQVIRVDGGMRMSAR